MKAFEYDISESYTCIDVNRIKYILIKDFKKLKAALLKLFNKYV